ncbi:hypothetical protein Taro_027763, partial [Colocasia esculenta]|nr:hypothetical protein [Colocasia esculenta]
MITAHQSGFTPPQESPFLSAPESRLSSWGGKKGKTERGFINDPGCRRYCFVHLSSSPLSVASPLFPATSQPLAAPVLVPVVDSRVSSTILLRLPPFMAARSSRRTVSFNILASCSSGDGGGLRFPFSAGPASENGEGSGTLARKRGKPKGSKKKKKKKRIDEGDAVADEPLASGFVEAGFSPRENGHPVKEVRFSPAASRSVVETVCESSVVEQEVSEGSQVSCVSFAELRQRNVNGVGLGDASVEEETTTRESGTGQWRPASNGGVTMLKKEESLDWNKVIAEHPDILE